MTSELKRRFTISLLSALLLASCSGSADPLKTPLTALENIQLPAPAAEFGAPSLDLLTMDPRNGLLYVPYTNTLDVVDTRTKKLKGQVANVPGIKSIVLSPDPNVVFTADGGNNQVAVVDVAKLQIIDEIKTPL